MSLLPYFFDDHWTRPDWRRNRDLFDVDFFQPTIPRSLIRFPDYFRNLEAALQDTGSSVKYDKDKFYANFDVQHFKPNEISVKVTGDRTVTVEGKHEEKQDEHGHIYRHFVRKYVVPENCDMERLESKLSTDGVLTVSVPRTGEKIDQTKEIPISRTGKPAKSLEDKKSKL
ncbi:alpha-crystallin A chain [Leptinotarsa decemlineata]|uniref:alpha-crystallin A chain n=1 Tax=Leptinotarsa decemlineata TaxID=7539 RepID=UPI000C255AD2|nr:alpha-crystallin B chain-like [Leptinotarsa decemlineata]